MYKNHHKGLQERKLNITGPVVSVIHLGIRSWNDWSKLNLELLDKKFPAEQCSSVCNREFCDSVGVTATVNFLSHGIEYFS